MQSEIVNKPDLIEIFSEIIKLYPNEIAIVYQEQKINYAELDKLSEAVLQILKDELDLSKGDRIALILSPSLMRIVIIIAIVKGGGIYVPLDPDFPLERIRLILQDAKVNSVITDSEKNISGIEVKKITLKSIEKIIKNYHYNKGQESKLDSAQSGMNEEIYIMYTSGSTGRPKGVRIGWRAVVRLAQNETVIDFQAGMRMAQAANFAFDASTYEIWVPLLRGGTVIVVEKEIIGDATLLKQTLFDQKITVLWLTSGLFNHFISNNNASIFARLKYLIIGGEALSVTHVQRFLNEPACYSVTLINGYGPTEATTFTTFYHIKSLSPEQHSVPIGKPLTNTICLLVKDNHLITKTGEEGELYIGGEGLSLGYEGNEELTRQKFSEIQMATKKKLRFYKSGDICKWLPTGDLEFVGRNDEQCKINGIRIELGEIRASLERHPDIEQVFLQIRRSDGKTSIRAYILPKRLMNMGEDSVLISSIEKWRRLYDEFYQEKSLKSSKVEELVGWNDSYLGSAIPESAMRAWQEETVEKILKQKPKKILEIGCGTGLLLFKLLPYCEKYLATDFSDQVLSFLRKRADLLSIKEKKKLTLKKGEAKVIISELQDSKFDTVIINSVVQYFPNLQYLTEILNSISFLLEEGGKIVIGDLRNYDLRHAFYASNYQQKKLNKMLVPKAWWEWYEEKENELFVSPAYFLQIEQCTSILHCEELSLKSKIKNNELCRYRYDAILAKGKMAKPEKFISFKWDNDKMLEQRLAAGEVKFVYSIIPNQLLAMDYAMLKDEGLVSQTIDFQNGSTPYDLRKLAERYGYLCLFCTTEDPYFFQAIFSKEKGETLRCVSQYHKKKNAALSNIPKFFDTSYNSISKLRNYLAQYLPENMHPREYYFVDQLPLTSNGKVDVKQLENVCQNKTLSNSEQEKESGEDYTLECIKNIFAQVAKKGTNRIGANTNLYELGIDSLGALEVGILLGTAFRINLSLGTILSNPTPKLLEGIILNQDPEISVEIATLKMDEALELPALPSHVEKWQEHQSADLRTVNNVVYKLEFNGKVNFHLLKKTLIQVYHRHRTLKSNYFMKEEKLFYRVNQTSQNFLETITLAHLDVEKYYAEVQRIITSLQSYVPDLEQDLLYKNVLIEGSDKNFLLIYFHHIIMDLQSLEILVKEIRQDYYNFAIDQSFMEDEFAKDYIHYLHQNNLTQNSALYQKKLITLVDALKNKPRLILLKPASDCSGESIKIKFDMHCLKELEKIASSCDITLFAVLLSLFKLSLAQILDQKCFAVGIIVSQRSNERFRNTIGLMNNYLIIYSELNDLENYLDLVKLVSANLNKAYQTMECSHFDLDKELKRVEGANYKGLFNVFFDYQTMVRNEAIMSSSDLNVVEEGIIPINTVNRTISFRLSRNLHEATIGVRYRKTSVTPEIIRVLLKTFEENSRKFIQIWSKCDA